MNKDENNDEEMEIHPVAKVIGWILGFAAFAAVNWVYFKFFR